MADREPLTDSEIRDALARLPEWEYAGGRLTRTFAFGSFREAVSFIVRIAFEAEQLNHHPELTNVYHRVTIALTTHDADDRVTEMDLSLARRIDGIAWV